MTQRPRRTKCDCWAASTAFKLWPKITPWSPSRWFTPKLDEPIGPNGKTGAPLDWDQAVVLASSRLREGRHVPARARRAAQNRAAEDLLLRSHAHSFSQSID